MNTRVWQSTYLLLLFGISACSGTSPQVLSTVQTKPIERFNVQLPTDQAKRFKLNTVEAGEPSPDQLSNVAETLANPQFEFRFTTTSESNSIRIPEQGAFKLILEAGDSPAILDADATDGEARLRVSSGVKDLFLRAEKQTTAPICDTSAGSPSGTDLLNRLDQTVLDKANQLISQGKGQCVYLPPTNQRQNANCNSTSSGFQCSGPLNKTVQAAQCPEIAIYGGAMNINNPISSKLFVAVQNNLTINASVKGILSTRGDLNTSLNNNQILEGVFVGARSNNLNMGGTSRISGLYSIVNAGTLSMNANQNILFEGALCSTGNINRNLNGSSQIVYKPDLLNPWVADLPYLPGMICQPRANFYTQIIPKTCTAPTGNGNLQLTDTLYQIDQSLESAANTGWYHLPRRPVSVPEDWYSPDGQTYTLNLTNHGAGSMTLRGFESNSSALVPALVKVIPAVDCVQPNPQGGYTAWLSYKNLMSGPVTLPVGKSNGFEPAPADRGQPTRFESGQSAVFPSSPHAVVFDTPQLSWRLGKRLVTVQATDPAIQCPTTGEPRRPDLLISNVQLSATGESIFGKDAPGSIRPDYAGKEIQLTITGTFKDADGQALNTSDFLFTLAPPLIQQTFIGTEPNARVLLDDSILLEVNSVTATEIQATLHTQLIPDLYLKGLHRLSVEQGNWFTDSLIQVGEPEHTDYLFPKIDAVEILYDQNNPVHLLLKGKNLMLQPKFYYTLIDGQFGFGFQTEVIADGNAQTIVHIPNPETFSQKVKHLVILATPFGVAFKEF